MNSTALHNEKELLLHIAEGDERAFLILYKYYYTLLRPVVIKYLDSGIGAEAEEILQQAFLKVWLNREKLPEIDNVYGWIYRIAYREYLMAIRARLNYEDSMKKYSSSQGRPDNQVLPSDNRTLLEIKQSVQEVIDQLSPQRKAVYELSRKEGLKIPEIAEKLSITTQTVKNVLSIVLKMIREHLDAKGYGPFFFILFCNYFDF